MYKAIPCTCGHFGTTCTSYQVVGLTPEFKISKRKAEACAELLNKIDKIKMRGGIVTIKVPPEDRKGYHGK